MIKKKFIIQIVLIIIALTSSIYAVKLHYEVDSSGSFCNISRVLSCSTIDNSQYSEIFGLSVGIFGIAYALFNLAVLVVKTFRPKFVSERNLKYLLQLNLITNTVGVLGSLVFTGIQIFIIGVICINCMIFHIANIGYTAFLYKEALQKPAIKKEKQDK